MLELWLRWTSTMLLQLALCFALGFVVPYLVGSWTQWQTLWFLPVGLVLGAWLGGFLIWPQAVSDRWACAVASSVGSLAAMLLAHLQFVTLDFPYLGLILPPMLAFDVVALLKRR